VAWLEVFFVSMRQRGSAATICNVATVRMQVEPGSVDITVVKEGFAPVTTRVTLASGQVQTVVVELQWQPTVEEQSRCPPHGQTSASIFLTFASGTRDIDADREVRNLSGERRRRASTMRVNREGHDDRSRIPDERCDSLEHYGRRRAD